jgi:TolB-like protein
LTETIRAELGAGRQLRLISGENVAAMQQDLAPPPGVGLSRKQLDEIGRNLGCDLILTGNYLLTGGRLRVDVRLDDIASAEPVASLGVEENERKLLDLVAAASRELFAKLRISPPLASHRRRLARAASGSRRCRWMRVALLTRVPWRRTSSRNSKRRHPKRRLPSRSPPLGLTRRRADAWKRRGF